MKVCIKHTPVCLPGSTIINLPFQPQSGKYKTNSHFSFTRSEKKIHVFMFKIHI